MVHSTRSNYKLISIEEVVALIPAIVFIYNIATRNYEWNNWKFKDILGFDQEEISQMMDNVGENFIHPSDKYILDERKDYFKNSLQDTWSGVYRIKHREGHWLWVYTKVVVIERDSNTLPVKLLGITLDATESFETKELFNILLQERIKSRNQVKINNLTAREIEIICLIAQGDNHQDIATKLNIQPDTVNKHRKNILSKLCLRNIASIAYFAKENGLA